MSRIVQKYYSISELAWTYGFADTTVRRWVKQGLFGPESEFLRIAGDVRIPTSGALYFEENHKNRVDAAQVAAARIRGRTLGEARRRAREQANSPNVCTQ